MSIQQENINSRNWTLSKEQELRLEIAYKEEFRLKLISGTAEIFGTELVKDIWYDFTDVKIAIFSWDGCELIGEGNFLVEYIAGETPMPTYLNLHLALEGLRKTAEETGGSGPRVIILGPKDSGKTSISKILLNYSVRQAREPIFIDLNCLEGTVTLPGNLSATPISYILDAEKGFNNLHSNKNSVDSIPKPLTYYYGSPKPSDNIKFYYTLVERLSIMVKKRLENIKANKLAGCIIDTASFNEDSNFDLHMECIKAFDVNVVIVVGHERLYSDMLKSTKDNKDITVLRLAKSGGVVNRDQNVMRDIQSRKIREYFYGSFKNELTPSPNVIPFNELNIFKIGEGDLAPSSALPVGMDRKISQTKLTRVEPSSELQQTILAVYNTNSTEEEIILKANALGFVYVSDVDQINKTITLLLPAPGKLPRTTLLMGSFRWFEP